MDIKIYAARARYVHLSSKKPEQGQAQHNCGPNVLQPQSTKRPECISSQATYLLGEIYLVDIIEKTRSRRQPTRIMPSFDL